MESGVVVTGSSGFLGKKLVSALKTNGHDVVGVDLTPSDSTHHVVDITSSRQVARTLGHLAGHHLIHGAFPLPGKLRKRDLLDFVERSSDSLLSIPWSKQWVISSTAVYPTFPEDLEICAPWEAYGQAKLLLERRFLTDTNSSAALALRLGTLLGPDSTSTFSKLIRRSLSGKVSPLPRGGSLVHPISSPDGVSNWVAQSLGDSFNHPIQLLLSRNRMSVRQYLENSNRIPIVPKFVSLPAWRMGFLDCLPLFGVSSWHLRALHYDFSEVDKAIVDGERSHLLGDYSVIFDGL